ncbi:hypothetical protein [Legionella maioricensis]|uniref:Uncharacterized protein n=1 Tax=Legionella maioricensis TaxID=2896528 RepID=A0A9X2D2Y7_9GAMM|nr:hypothetical protein [Legionella maioricensis]MCL9685364.1 hypothetical protein [Legionella maioricensis]MCL9689280.1 hypothetical protein [Legionella maioricensis]
MTVIHTKIQAEIINQQRKLLCVYSGLSTEAEFSLKLNSIIEKLLLNDEHFKESNPSTLREELLTGSLYSENQEPIFLQNEITYQKVLADLSFRLKNNPESFLKALTDYKNTFGPEKMGSILSRKFLDIDPKKQTCLLNIAIETAFKNEENYSDEPINQLLKLGVEIDVDFGYHGQRHPLREVPPLIKAIQKSNESDSKNKQAFYTRIAEKLITNGASINKLNDNPSPLWTAYNPKKIPETLSKNTELSYDHQSDLSGALRQFKIESETHVRNKEFFDLLIKKGAKLDEMDIMQTSVQAPYKIFRDFPNYKAFQLLYLIDEDLRRNDLYTTTQRQQIKDEFFNPLFEATYATRIETAERLKGYQFEFGEPQPDKPNSIFIFIKNEQLNYGVWVNNQLKIERLEPNEYLDEVNIRALIESCDKETKPAQETHDALIEFMENKGYIIRENESTMNQKQLDQLVQKGELYSNVTTRYSGNVNDVLDRIRQNESGYIMSFMFTQEEKPFNMIENQCMAGEYAIPTQYIGGKRLQMLEGVGFKYTHVNPHITSKTDIFSIPKQINFYDPSRDSTYQTATTSDSRHLSSIYAVDLELKVSDSNAQKLYEKAQEANQRRLGAIEERATREPFDLSQIPFFADDLPKTASDDELLKVAKQDKQYKKALHHSKTYSVLTDDYLHADIRLIKGVNVNPMNFALEPEALYFYMQSGVLCAIQLEDRVVTPVSLENLTDEMSNKISQMLIDDASDSQLSLEDKAAIARQVEFISANHIKQTSVYHGECVADIYQFDMILDIINTREAASMTADESHRREHQRETIKAVGSSMDEYLLNLRALQKQRQTFLFTGRHVPIARTDAVAGETKMLQIDEINSIRMLLNELIRTSEHRKSKAHKHLLGLNSLISPYLKSHHLTHSLQKLAAPGSLDERIAHMTKKEKEYLLIWSLDMGFRDLSKELIKRNVQLSGTLSCEKEVLKSVISKGLVDEAQFLMDHGIKLTDYELSSLSTVFDTKFNYLIHFNSSIQYLVDKPEPENIVPGKLYFYVQNNTELHYVKRDKFGALNRHSVSAGNEISQNQLNAIVKSIATSNPLTNDEKRVLSKAVPEMENFGQSPKKIEVHFSSAFHPDQLNFQETIKKYTDFKDNYQNAIKDEDLLQNESLRL